VDSERTLAVSFGRSDGSELNAASHAFAAVAESGTLVLTSGEANPTTLNFLPDNHIVVVNAKDVAGDYEEVWAKVRFANGKGQMPRTVNWITGPSRSADIEQTLLLGAHGPRRLHIVLVGRRSARFPRRRRHASDSMIAAQGPRTTTWSIRPVQCLRRRSVRNFGTAFRADERDIEIM
jgi:hypothetical protein